LRVPDDEGELRADQFATLVLTGSGNAKLVHAVMHAFTTFFVAFNELESDDGVHGRSNDRATLATCIVWRRTRPPLLASIMAGDRGRACDAYADEALQTWNAWLEPHTRIDTGEMFSEQ
jgi:hypothetical protein